MYKNFILFAIMLMVILMDELRSIERSIIKKFRKPIWSRFVRAIKDFKLINEHDHLAVCISGGKDSMLLAKCIQELHRHGQIKFAVKYILMNPGYSKEHLKLIKDNCKKLNIPIKIFKSNIFKIINKKGLKDQCYMCARMRRGFLYYYAKQLGCNKIVLGHHFNDVIETILLNVLYAGQYKTMMPKVKSLNFSSMELIRPFYYVKEDDIIAWVKYNNLSFIKCACNVTRHRIDSKRIEIKNLIRQLKAINPDVDISILRSAENVYLDSIIGYYYHDKFTHFLDEYDKK
jgi:tRNA 2-thiocytidine biosynthesis protein TtcA